MIKINLNSCEFEIQNNSEEFSGSFTKEVGLR